MESNAFRRPLVDTSAYPAQRRVAPSQVYAVNSSGDSFRTQTLPTQPANALNHIAPAPSSYNYALAEGAQFVSLQPSALQYNVEYGQDAQRINHNQYPQFSNGGNVVYSIPASQQPQGFPTPQYEPVQPYQQRNAPAPTVLSSQYAVAPQYFVPGQSVQGATQLASPLGSAQFAPLQYSQQQDRPYIGQSYMSAPPEAVHNSQSAMTHSASSNTADYDLVEAYHRYRTRLRSVYDCIRDMKLVEGAESLLELTTWLLRNVEHLSTSLRYTGGTHVVNKLADLTIDNPEQHESRLELWREFNNAWLTLFGQQKIMTEDEIKTGHKPAAPKTRIDFDTCEKIGDELVELCNDIENTGLVDYETGTWEKMIIEGELILLTKRCGH